MSNILYFTVVKQYDTYILPEVKDKSIISKLWGYIWPWKSDVADEMRVKCFTFYLNPLKALLLKGKFHSSFDVEPAVMRFLAVVNSSVCQYYGDASKVHEMEKQKLILDVSTQNIMSACMCICIIML